MHEHQIGTALGHRDITGDDPFAEGQHVDGAAIRAGLDDGVLAIAEVEHIDIRTIATVHRVVAGAADKHVVVRVVGHLQGVIAGTALQAIAARSGVQYIVAIATTHDVVARPAVEGIVTVRALRHVPLLAQVIQRPHRAIGKRHLLDQMVNGLAAAARGAAKPVLDRHLVLAIDVGKHQIHCALGRHDVAARDALAEGQHIDRSGICARLDDGVLAIAKVEHIHIRTVAAVQDVVAATADKHVVVGVAGHLQGVVAFPAEQPIAATATIQHVIPCATNKHIISCATIEGVRVHAANEKVIFRTTVHDDAIRAERKIQVTQRDGLREQGRQQLRPTYLTRLIQHGRQGRQINGSVARERRYELDELNEVSCGVHAVDLRRLGQQAKHGREIQANAIGPECQPNRINVRLQTRLQGQLLVGPVEERVVDLEISGHIGLAPPEVGGRNLAEQGLHDADLAGSVRIQHGNRLVNLLAGRQQDHVVGIGTFGGAGGMQANVMVTPQRAGASPGQENVAQQCLLPLARWRGGKVAHQLREFGRQCAGLAQITQRAHALHAGQ